MNYQTYVIDVNAPSGHICCNQCSNGSGLEILERACPSGLGLSTVESSHGNTLGSDFFGELVSSMFGASENKGSALASGNLSDHSVTILWMDHQYVVVHRADGCLTSVDGMIDGFAQVRIDEAAHTLIEGRAE
jgi:hypothetical protein